MPPSGSCHGRPCGWADGLARPVCTSANARTCGCSLGSIQGSSRWRAPRTYRAPVTPDHVNPERPWPEIDDLSRWTEGPRRSLVTAIVARYSSSPRSGVERIDVSSLDRKFWMMHSWIEPYSRATRRMARIESSYTHLRAHETDS